MPVNVRIFFVWLFSLHYSHFHVNSAVVSVCSLTEDAYEREYRERRERREREQRDREQRDKLASTATDKPIELTDKEKELEQMKVNEWI